MIDLGSIAGLHGHEHELRTYRVSCDLRLPVTVPSEKRTEIKLPTRS